MHRKYHLRYQGRFTRLASLARFLTAAAATRLLLALTAPLLIMPASAQAQGNDPGAPCPGGGYNPTPRVVEVAAVPIVVESTTTDYFVLYVSHEVDADTTVDIPVLVKRGEAGTTTLAENVEALPAARYRVEQYLVSDPADVDGDYVDDITELGDPVSMNPVNPAAAIALSVGTVAIPDRDTFDKLSYSDKYIKFVMFGMDTADRPGVYFMNTENYPDHRQFMEVIGLDWEQDGLLNGELTFHPELMSPSGNSGVYYYEFQREPIFSLMGHSHTLLAASIPLLDDNLALYISNGYLQYSQAELPLFRESRIPLLFDEDIHADTSFLSLNPGEGYGLLRVMDPDERPHPRDIVIYEALPNELPRVAGIVSTVPQTPLSHVNLRAVQDGVPNAFIRGALDEDEIDDLIGGYVRYTVTETGWDIRAATRAQVDAHYTSSRPTGEQTPQRDLSVTSITPLGEIGFEDWTAFGVKATNVAVLGTLGFPAGTVPNGFAIPFYFYDEFMKAHDFYTRIETMLTNEDFQTDFETQDDMLDDLRDDIEDADSPQWIVDALTAMHATYPGGQSLRYRSSTNNEDLPGFNGAGLYDSKTQDPEETEEDGIDKSLKGVFASLWNFRAFTERDLNRIDHLAAKMGVLVHPNYSDELANGVAVSFDPIRDLDGYYYVNTQVGEDLVTNPEAHSIPEELLLRRDQGTYAVLSTSNLVESGELLMSDAQLYQLRDHLTVIHERFAVLYNPAPDEPFAMEIEFKITSDNVLAIKQARPWVFSAAAIIFAPPFAPTAVALSLDPASVAEGGGARSITVTATLDAGARTMATAVTVSETADGTATSGTDYAAVTAFTVTIAANQTSGTATLTVTPTDDSAAEGPETVVLNASATDLTSGTATLTITDDDTSNDPVFTEGTSTTRSVAENTASGQNIGGTITATDADTSDTLTYTLGGADAAAFGIVSASGQLQTSAALDYETKASYAVTVSVSDGNGGTDSINVTINVTADRAALVALYNATGGVDWTNNTNWLSNEALSEWHRVETDEDGRVTALRLVADGLSGEIPAELANLTNLQVLSLSINTLSGEIPAELGNLANLQSLSLSANTLSGEIPAELGNLANLQELSLFDNELSGPLPLTLSVLSQLLVLDIRETTLCAPVDTAFQAWLATINFQGTVCATRPGGGGGGGFGGGGGGGGGGPRTSAPEVPRNLTAVGGDGQVVLTWEAPASDGGTAITDYEVRINQTGEWISIGSTDTTHAVTGLVNGTAYAFQVRAVNAVGSSAPSNQTEATPELFTLDFAHFANGEGITSGLVFVNVATHPIRLGLDFYDKEGNPIAAETVVDVTEDLEITEDGALSVRTAMEPLGELTISTHGREEVVSGSVKVVSNGPIGGFLRFDLPGIGVAGVGASPPVRDALFPARRGGGGISTAAAVHNIEEEAIVVSCRLMSGGVVLEEMEIALAAYGQEAQFIEEMFTTTDTSNFVGLVRCTGPGRFTGVAVELDAASRIFTTLPVVPVNLRGRGREAVLDFAHFANGEGITSDLVFVNVETQPSGSAPTPFHVAIPPIRPTLYFYDKEGNPIAAESVVEITGDLEVRADGGLSVRTEMEPLGELTISTHGQGEVVSGSVRVVSNGPIGGVLRFDLPGIGVAGVGASQPVRDALFPARREGDLSTAAAIRNLGEEAIELSCQLMSGGIVLEAVKIDLEANGQEARYIEELFPRTDTSDFVGSVRCTAPGEGAFTGVAVELDASNQIFTTLPVVPVPERMSQE